MNEDEKQIWILILSFSVMWMFVTYMADLEPTMLNYWRAMLLSTVNYVLGSLGLFYIGTKTLEKSYEPNKK